MKYKQQFPKSVRPITVQKLSHNINRERLRCSLCDSLLKPSTSHRYLLTGRSVHEAVEENITYFECCRQYLKGAHEPDTLHMLCPRCCETLQRIYKLNKDAEVLKTKLQRTWYKTKRLNQARHSHIVRYSRGSEHISSPAFQTTIADHDLAITVKKEADVERIVNSIQPSTEKSIAISQTIPANIPCDLPNTQTIPKKILAFEISHPVDNNNMRNRKEIRRKSNTKTQISVSQINGVYSHLTKQSQKSNIQQSNLFKEVSHSETRNSSEDQQNNTCNSNGNGQTTFQPHFDRSLIEPPLSSSSSSSFSIQRLESRDQVRRHSNSSNEEPSLGINYIPSIDDDRSLSPPTNDEDTSSMHESKSTRLSRRQYLFLVKLPDQQSLNAFIETSSAESGSRWTWRRTSANSRGYKVYYVCNFSMRRHYHPCPAAMYALFHPEGNISIYSCGQHQHIPKDRIPVSITNETKDEIFKCLQSGMTTTDIREHLTRLQLPFGDARKLNNFIKYHKELLRFGTVTNVRIGGTAYRQPQCWAIRRQQSAPLSLKVENNDAPTETTF